MSKYGSGISFQQAKLYDREEIIHALKGEIRIGEDESGFIYDKGPKDKCEKVILDNFDEAVYNAIEANRTGRVLEGILSQRTLPEHFGKKTEEERQKDYEGVYFREVFDKVED